VVKKTVAPPFRRVELEIMFGKGISASGSLVDAAVKCGIVDKKGAWYTYGDEKLGQGRENVKLNLEQNPALTAEIEAKVRAIFFPSKEEIAAAAAAKAAAISQPAPRPAAKPSPAEPPASPRATPAASVAERSPKAAKPAADDEEGLF